MLSDKEKHYIFDSVMSYTASSLYFRGCYKGVQACGGNPNPNPNPEPPQQQWHHYCYYNKRYDITCCAFHRIHTVIALRILRGDPY